MAGTNQKPPIQATVRLIRSRLWLLQPLHKNLWLLYKVANCCVLWLLEYREASTKPHSKKSIMNLVYLNKISIIKSNYNPNFVWLTRFGIDLCLHITTKFGLNRCDKNNYPKDLNPPVHKNSRNRGEYRKHTK